MASICSYAPLTATDYVAPSIWQVEAISGEKKLEFEVWVKDDSGEVERVVVLYREEGEGSWSRVLDHRSRVLLISTEGATDPLSYSRIVSPAK